MLSRLHQLTAHKHRSAGNKSAYLFCPQRIESVVQGLTTGGKCYHYNPHDRSCWRWCPPPLSRSGLWGADLGCLWKYEAEFRVATATWFINRVNHSYGLNYIWQQQIHQNLQLCLYSPLNSIAKELKETSGEEGKLNLDKSSCAQRSNLG